MIGQLVMIDIDGSFRFYTYCIEFKGKYHMVNLTQSGDGWRDPWVEFCCGYRHRHTALDTVREELPARLSEFIQEVLDKQGNV